MTTLTVQDVRDAAFAKTTKGLAEVEECSERSIIREFLNEGVSEDAEMARYTRGEALLKEYKLVESPSSTAGGRFSDEVKATLVSPIVEFEAGHIAAATAYAAMALAPRKRKLGK